MKHQQKYQTLHCHTLTSDGKLTHFEVLDICTRTNIGTVAFTDHDSLPSKKIIDQLMKLKHPTQWIIGIEMSSGKPKDFDKNYSPHIVGLFVDPFNRELVRHCQLAQEARIERMKEMVENISNLGFELSGEDCLKASGGEAVGRPHIVKALRSHKSYETNIERLRTEMEKASKHDKKVDKEYREMMERGPEQYPYMILLSDDAFIKGVYVDYKYRLDLDSSVELIRNAGGVALFAHWFTEKKVVKEEDMEKLLREDRLDGAETVYGWDALTEEKFTNQTSILRKIIKQYKKLEGGGVDAHGVEHFEWMSKHYWYAKNSVGLAEKMIQSGKVDITWSSFGKN